MDLKNLIAAIFIVIIVLTLLSIPSYQSGYFLVPSSRIESAVIMIIISIFIIIVMLLPRKSSIY